MSDDPVTCVICHEYLEPEHTVVQGTTCDHTFHTICIHIWLARHSGCPICRQRISIDTHVQWRALFTTALVITREMALERAAYTYSFISILLKSYYNARRWFSSREALISAMEQFDIGSVRLPFIDLSSRTTAKREKRKWAVIYESLADEPPRNSERISSARRRVIGWANLCAMGVYVP